MLSLLRRCVDRIRPAALIAAAALALSLAKLWWTETSSRDILGCAWCTTPQAVPHEVQWLLGLALLHAASRALGAFSRPLAAVLRAVVLGMLLVAVVDLVVLQQFFVRLSIGEVQKFVGEPQAVRGFVGQLSPPAMLLALAAAAAAACVGWGYLRQSAAPPLRRRGAWLAAAAAAGVAAAAPLKVDDQHTPYLQNSAEALFESPSRDRAYSEGFAARLAAAAAPGGTAPQRCVDGLGATPDVMLLMIESLSLYHSARFSGIEDWTPGLDRLAGDGLALLDFSANGVISEQAMIALLTGEPPIERPGGAARALFEAYLASPDTVPRLMRRAGYTARFISGFNLDFPGLQAFLAAVGFDSAEGQESPFYRGRSTQRLHFDSVPDELLFERLLHELAQPRSAPRFITAFTQSTHHPYVDPSSGERTQQAALRYLDRALSRFVDALRERRYFDNGLLLIVGDHRAMQPMGERERERFGDRGFARVPMVVLGSVGGQPLRGASPAAFSQTDLLPSLRHLVGRERFCLAADQGIFLPAPLAAPSCIYTRRPYNANRVYARCGERDAVVQLDGDDSRYVGAAPREPVLDTVNRLRLGLGFPR